MLLCCHLHRSVASRRKGSILSLVALLRGQRRYNISWIRSNHGWFYDESELSVGAHCSLLTLSQALGDLERHTHQYQIYKRYSSKQHTTIRNLERMKPQPKNTYDVPVNMILFSNREMNVTLQVRVSDQHVQTAQVRTSGETAEEMLKFRLGRWELPFASSDCPYQGSQTDVFWVSE